MAVYDFATLSACRAEINWFGDILVAYIRYSAFEWLVDDDFIH